ncbi:PepSY-associated TM helix domain-containing protein [Vibrio rumoiensis]|uniref:Peptidase n=1 Tax=Vibrio rumoiensis 1S-45 TaxID=1188252 RepID=A0A1E5E0C5_9VIBR|nr:PepSY domain-containing protein [Vibrio rumoiensis]OEF23892.1 hypothetical protein A1QC_01715 [Vibrio rumoiensis 1S-45]
MFSTPQAVDATGADAAQSKKTFYFMAWRWHFYAGLFVVPFMIMLALTGLVMLYGNTIEDIRYQSIIQVTPSETLTAPSLQLSQVQQHFPDSTIKEFIPSHQADQANRFAIVKPDGSGWFVLVNQYSAAIQGEISRDNLYALANDIHGSLLIGDMGDRLVETAASLAIVLLMTGLYMWWPRDNASKAGFFKLRLSSGKRIFWRDLHTNIGGVTSIFLLFFLITGLSWAGIWGGKMVQAWSSFPEAKYDNIPLSKQTHASMNHGATEEVPWNLEQVPMPVSQVPTSEQDAGQEVSKHSGHGAISPQSHYAIHAHELNAIVEKGQQLGFGYFRVRFPQDATGVYTLSADTMSGDISNPTQDRTVHIDQYSKQIIIDFNWNEYSPMAKFMAAGIAFHEGDIGLWNKALNTALCLFFIFIAVSGVVMWWLRKPTGQMRLVPPPLPKNSQLWKRGAVVMVVTAIVFPMAGIAIVSMMLLDFILLSRVPSLARLVK